MCIPEKKEKRRKKKERKTKIYEKKQGNKYCNFCMGVKYLEESERAATQSKEWSFRGEREN